MANEIEFVTLTLPFLTWQGLNFLLAALGVAGATGLVWLMLTGAERDQPPTLESWFRAFAWVLLPVWVWLLGATLWGLWQVFNGFEGATLGQGSLGLGALIAAFLGAPFVIYGTYLRHKTQRLEQEGHMTDRINKAVEQLGAEKTAKRHLINSKGKKVFAKDADGNLDFSRPTIVEETMPNIEVRLGAILSLERIAQDSTIHDKGRDHVRVMEILCAYIRENSNSRKPEDYPEPEWKPLRDGATREEYTAHLEKRKAQFHDEARTSAFLWARTLPKPRADIQLALTVIGRRTSSQRRVEAAWPTPPNDVAAWPFDLPCPELPHCHAGLALTPAELETFREKLNAWRESLKRYSGYRLDLRGSNLQGADMAAKQPDGSGAEFSGALLDGTRLEGANLANARLQGACLESSRMDGANCSGSFMGCGMFFRASLIGTDLAEAKMECADFRRAKLINAELNVATLIATSWGFAHIEDSFFSNANLTLSDFGSARISGTSFWLAKFEYAKFKNVLLLECKDVEKASFRYSYFFRSDLRTFPIRQEQLETTFGDASVTLPKHILRPNRWPDWKLPWSSDQYIRTEWHKWQANPDTYIPPKKSD